MTDLFATAQKLSALVPEATVLLRYNALRVTVHVYEGSIYYSEPDYSVRMVADGPDNPKVEISAGGSCALDEFHMRVGKASRVATLLESFGLADMLLADARVFESGSMDDREALWDRLRQHVPERLRAIWDEHVRGGGGISGRGAVAKKKALIDAQLVDQNCTDTYFMFTFRAGTLTADTVVVEVMPRHLRASHEAAGNRGFYPDNGAVRAITSYTAAIGFVGGGDSWSRVLRASTRVDFEHLPFVEDPESLI